MAINIYHTADADDDLTATEALLAQLIEEYRVQNGLGVIPLSKSLSLVGARHDEDILFNLGGYQAGIPGQNSAHGWSDAPYNALDPSTYPAIWHAPQRLGTQYPGNGYEILSGYFAPNTMTALISPQAALNGWKGSPPHNAVILNQSPWNTPSLTWGALGIGMLDGVASAWFGHESDPAGSPDVDLQGRYSEYTIAITPTTIQVQDKVTNRDPSFTIPNAANLNFTDGIFSIAAKVFIQTGPFVYRLFDTKDGTHFFTSSAGEVSTILATRSDLTYEGIGLANSTPGSDLMAAPVYRFFDTVHGTHFYTADAFEKDSVVAGRPDLKFEGAGFYEHTTQQRGDTAVYRFFDTKFGTHFYTASADERASISLSRPDLKDEGIGFYAPSL